MRVIGEGQFRRFCGLGERRHHGAFGLVRFQQNRQQTIRQTHQVTEVGDVVFGNRGINQRERLKASAGLERHCNIVGRDFRHVAEHCVCFCGARGFAINQHRPQIACAFGERGALNQRTFSSRECEHFGQHADVVGQANRRIACRFFQRIHRALK